MEECTISTAEDELDQLLQKATGKALPGGWKLEKAAKKAVFLVNKKGVEVSISRTIITNAIDISHWYIDIITRKEFWYANPRYLKKEYAEPVMALLSLADITQYYDYETLIARAQLRLEASEEKVRIKEILKASESGDLNTIKTELKRISKNPKHQEEMRRALYNALERKDEAMARLLVLKGIDLNQAIYVNGRNHGIMEYVVKSQLDSILHLCLKSGIKPDSYCNANLVRIACSNKTERIFFI